MSTDLSPEAQARLAIAKQLVEACRDQPEPMAAAVGITVAAFSDAEGNIDSRDVSVALGAVVSAYLGAAPIELRVSLREKFIDVLSKTTGVEAASQSILEVRKMVKESIRVQAMTWEMEPADRRFIEEMLLEILPDFDAYIHECRLKGASPNTLRGAGTFLLAIMLNSLVRNTTLEKAARQSVLRRLHKAILEHAEFQP